MAARTETLTDERRDADRWDLNELYAGPEAWKQAASAFEARLPDLAGKRGTLGSSARRLLEALELMFDLQRDYQSLASWAHMSLDLDRRDGEALARAGEIDLAGTRLAAASSFIAPEILALPEGTVERFHREERALGVYAHALDGILRKRRHTLPAAEEKLLADAGAIAVTAENLYGVLANADIPWPEIDLSTGERARLDPSSFVKHRTASNRDDRRRVFQTFFGSWTSYARTLGVALGAEVRKNIFYARARGYGSALEASLDLHRVPVGVYDAVVGAAREGIGSFHRYMRLRARLLGIDDLAYHDIYAPLVPALERKYGVEEAKDLVLEAVSPLGERYVETLGRGFASRWIDVWPSPGKRSGAYSNGAVYGKHPFILMNYTGNFDAVRTLAHESGHAMHSHLANETQPFPTADYAIFVAEVASTFNEALVYRRSIDRAESDEEKLFLLTMWLDGIRGTFFRQSMFAEFERSIHRAAEEGMGLTADRLGATFLDLVREYQGSAQGVCAVDDLYRVEWAYIPHFYANFYVFQYATGFAASTFLARRVLDGEAGAAESFLEFLAAGGSDYPYDLLKRAGVDLSRPEPYRETIAEMERVMDEVDAILARSAPGRLDRGARET